MVIWLFLDKKYVNGSWHDYKWHSIWTTSYWWWLSKLEDLFFLSLGFLTDSLFVDSFIMTSACGLSSWPMAKLQVRQRCMVQVNILAVTLVHRSCADLTWTSWLYSLIPSSFQLPHDCMLCMYHPASSNLLRPRQLIVQCTEALHENASFML